MDTWTRTPNHEINPFSRNYRPLSDYEPNPVAVATAGLERGAFPKLTLLGSFADNYDSTPAFFMFGSRGVSPVGPNDTPYVGSLARHATDPFIKFATTPIDEKAASTLPCPPVKTPLKAEYRPEYVAVRCKEEVPPDAGMCTPFSWYSRRR